MKVTSLNKLTDDQLLQLRLCDLPLRMKRTPMQRRIRHLYKELESRKIRAKPHVWISNEFFTPDGVPGFAVPFYLMHPRLQQLERKNMLEIEGATEKQCLRILRHEAGHALDNAYRLHQKKSWRTIFGSVSKPYPEFYRPKPNSRQYVLHLDAWYAQAHPLEDYAETFAVWLRPNSRWKSRYKDWYALRKLEYIDGMMKKLAGRIPPNRRRVRVEPISELKQTLGEYYLQKKQHYSLEYPPSHDRDLRRIFSEEPAKSTRPLASSYLRAHRREFREIVAEGTGVHVYSVDHILRKIIDRARDLRLRINQPESITKRQTIIFLTVQVMNMVHSGRYRFWYGV